MSGRGGVDVAFVDRAGVSWARRAMGPLDELPMRPLEHFGKHGLFGPHEFQVPESANDSHQMEPDIAKAMSTFFAASRSSGYAARRPHRRTPAVTQARRRK